RRQGLPRVHRQEGCDEAATAHRYRERYGGGWGFKEKPRAAPPARRRRSKKHGGGGEKREERAARVARPPCQLPAPLPRDRRLHLYRIDMRDPVIFALVCAAATAAAKPVPVKAIETKAIDMKPVAGKLDVFKDDQGNYYVVPNAAFDRDDDTAWVFAGDGK